MAHVNTAGVHVPIWLDSNDAAIGWGIDRVNYPMQEGTFFGDILDTGALTNIGKPTVTAPVAYYCDGAGFPAGANGVVAGRLGANQTGAPYKNPFGNGALCQSPTYSTLPSTSATSARASRGSCPVGLQLKPRPGLPRRLPDSSVPIRNERASWTTASLFGATTATRRCSIPATSTPSRPSSPQAARWWSTAAPRRCSSGTSRLVSPPPSSTWRRAAAAGPSRR